MGNHHGEPDWSVYQSGRPLLVPERTRATPKAGSSKHIRTTGAGFLPAKVLPRGTVSMAMEVDNGPWSLGTPENGIGLGCSGTAE